MKDLKFDYNIYFHVKTRKYSMQHNHAISIASKIKW